MSKVHKINEDFEFDRLVLEHPNSLQGGAYFTRIQYDSIPLYVQTDSCMTKNGIIKTAKKAYCDLMFNSSNDRTLQWLEQLENACINKIFEKRDLWFHNEMEYDDIESSFVSPIRLYKSGKYYLVRCYLANLSIANGLFKCYDESSNPISIDVLENNQNKIIPLIEVQGIKFTSRNFTIELSLKQVMVLENMDFNNTCFIKRNSLGNVDQPDNPRSEQSIIDEKSGLESEYLNIVQSENNQPTVSSPDIENPTENKMETESKMETKEEDTKEEEPREEEPREEEPREEKSTEDILTKNGSNQDSIFTPEKEELRENSLEESENNKPENLNNTENDLINTPSTTLLNQENNDQELTKEEEINNEQELTKEEEPNNKQELTEEEPTNKQELTAEETNNEEESNKLEQLSNMTELDIGYDNLGNDETVQLRTPQEVYYDLWYEARNRAKLAKEEAIKAYLEAKNIKNTYLLDDFSESDEEYLEE